MKTDLSPDTDVSLLPRADLPVIWDAFKAKADAVRATAETLTVTCITQKEEMALARTTRLTLREIRIAVENKRVELGESHLKEIKKVNGAANAIKEYIQPLEARLLVQEEFGERAEAARIAELSKSRFDEVKSLRPGSVASVWSHLGTMPDEEYDNLLARLREEKEEIEAANRLRIEAEKRLAEQAIEMRRQEEEFMARLQAEKVAENARLAAQRAEAQAEQDRQHAAARVELDRVNAIAEAKALEIHAALKAQHEAERAIRVIEAVRLETERAVREIEIAEQKRIRDEQFAALEAERAALEEQIASAALDAARVAAVEEKRLRDIACAPDVDKLRAFSARLLAIEEPGDLTTPEALAVRLKAVAHLAAAVFVIDVFCGE